MYVIICWPVEKFLLNYLESGALLRQLSDSVQNKVNNFLSNGVVAPGIIVSCIFLAGDELLGVEELPIGSHANLVDDGGFQVDKYGTGHVLASPGLGEERVEGVIATSKGLVRGHLAIRLDTMLKAIIESI